MRTSFAHGCCSTNALAPSRPSSSASVSSRMTSLRGGGPVFSARARPRGSPPRPNRRPPPRALQAPSRSARPAGRRRCCSCRLIRARMFSTRAMRTVVVPRRTTVDWISAFRPSAPSAPTGNRARAHGRAIRPGAGAGQCARRGPSPARRRTRTSGRWRARGPAARQGGSRRGTESDDEDGRQQRGPPGTSCLHRGSLPQGPGMPPPVPAHTIRQNASPGCLRRKAGPHFVTPPGIRPLRSVLQTTAIGLVRGAFRRHARPPSLYPMPHAPCPISHA